MKTQYILSQITALLQLSPKDFLRTYGRIHIIGPHTEEPKFILVPANEGKVLIDLPKGCVDIVSIGFAGKSKALRLSVSGDMPTTLANKLLSAINPRMLDVDDTGHCTYGFFAGDRGECSHFVKGPNSSETIRLYTIDGKPVTKFEFAELPNGTLELNVLANGRAYRCNVSVDEVKGGLSFGWTPITTKEISEVYDLSTRIVDGKISTWLGTKNGVVMVRDNEVTFYKETKGQDICSIAAGFSGRYSGYPKATKGYDNVGQMAFVVRKNDGKMELFTAPLNPSEKTTSVAITDEYARDLANQDGARVILGDNAQMYIGNGRGMAAVGVPQATP